MLKRIFCILLSVICFSLTFACKVTYGKNDMAEILKDVGFIKGFGAMDISSANGYGVKRELSVAEGKHEHDWLIAQWGTRHSFEHDMKREVGTENGKKFVKFYNQSKEAIAYPGSGKLKLNAFGSKDYTRPRVSGEDWVHLLLEQVFTGSQRVPFSQMEKLEMSITFNVERCENMMNPEQYDPSIHAGQIAWFITVENSKSTEVTPEGRPDYMWFGLSIFDNRNDGMQGANMMDWGTMKLIYSVGKEETLGKKVEVGQTYTIKYDILPKVREAFNIAQGNGSLKGAEFENMVIGSMNLGWELPGTFDAEFTIENISIAYSKDLK